jgi:hypothetical protein
MSYDLAVFDPDAAPKEREAFVNWFGEMTEWEESHSYDDPKVTTPNLRAWFMEMLATYPAMNGPFSKEELPDDEACLTDYSVGKSLIYVGFAWSKAEDAHPHLMHLAEKHRVGIFNMSSDESDVWLSDSKGKLTLVHSD